MVTTVYSLSDIPKAFSEVHGILPSKGEIILAIIGKNSNHGKKYKIKKFSTKLYQDVHFHSTEELTAIL